MHIARTTTTVTGLRMLSAFAAIAALGGSTTVLAVAQATPAAPAPANAAQAAPAASSTAASTAKWTGYWTGKVSTAQVTPPGQTPIDMPIYLRVAGTPEAPVVEVTAARANALAKAARSPRIDGRKMTFLLESAGRSALLEGEISEDGNSVTGSFGFVDADGKAIPPTLPWTMRRTDAVTEVASARTYSGTLEVQAQKIPMKIALGEGTHGWCGAVEIAAQGLRNFPIEVVRTADGFDLTMPLGLPALVRLTGDASSNTLNGMFTQGPVTVPISFTAEAGAKLAGSRRPQDPVAPFPYTDREVVIDHIFGHKLAGTFTVPNDKSLAVDGRLPVVVLVTGSGAQDRDESLFGHRPFAVIADALARAGVAVLRYDDRGVGGSTGEHSMCTSYDFATDADMATEWLKKQPEIDPRRIGMVGHSEGAMIAPLVAEWQNKGDEPENPLAFVVLLAAPVEPCAAVLNRQTQMLYDAAGVPKERSKPAVDAHERVMRAILDKRPNAEIRPLVAEMVALQLAAAGQSVPDEATFNATIDAAMDEVAGKWMLTFIRHDPRSSIVVNEVPILAMWGSLDTQIDPNSNSSLITALTLPAGRPATVKVYPGLNHLFQPAKTGSPDEYGTIETTFDPTALADMVAWVVDTARKVPLPQIPEATRPGIRIGGAATDENTPAPAVQRPVEPNSQRLLTPAGAAPTGSPK
jgi:pimeloyl-ACP methyl ester carboxylesterase